MKYIRSYKIFENEIPIEDTYLKIQETIEELRNICLDLEDEGLSYLIYPSGSPEKLKTISLIHYTQQGITGEETFYLDIYKKSVTSGSNFPYSKDNAFRVTLVQDVISRIESFMKTEGWLCDIEFEGMDYPDDAPDKEENPLVDLIRINFDSATKYLDD